MEELAHDPDELRAYIKFARKKPISFGLNLGKQDDEHYFLMDRRKKPEIIGRMAKADGPGTKFTFGTVEVKGKVMNLSTEKLLPNLAKKLKKFLKSQKITMNVVILDPDGNVMDSDVEDLPSDPDGYDEIELADANPLRQRLNMLENRWEDICSPDVLTAPFKKVGAIVDQGEEGPASIALDRIEAALDKLENSPSAPAAPTDDDDLKALMARFSTLKYAVTAVENEAIQAKLFAALKDVGEHLKKGARQDTSVGLDRLQAALVKVGSIPDAPPLPPEASGSPPKASPVVPRDPAEVAKADAKARLGDIKTSLAKLKDMDPEALTAMRDKIAEFQTLMASGSFEQAADMMDDIELELAAALPPSNVGFQKLRLRWLDAKKVASKNIDTLRSTLLAEFSDQDSVSNVSRLDEVLGQFNEGLGDMLDDFASSEPGDTRKKHKEKSRQIVANYLQFLNGSPLVNHVENNPFAPVALRVTLSQPLMLLDAELAKAGA